MARYKIVLSQVFGPLRTIEAVEASKKYLENTAQGIKFGKTTKTSKGYRFVGSLTHVKAFDAPLNAVKDAVKKQAPNSKVTVTKL